MRTDPMNTGIYAIRHVASGKLYVGSALSFAARWRVHRCLLRKGAHHSPLLQAAWNKYGEGSFTFEKLLVCGPDMLLTYEQTLIDGYKAADRRFGFNARPMASSNLGMKLSESARAKVRAARAKQVFSAETRALWSKNRTGKKMPEWFGEFTRQHRTGVKHTEEARAKIGAANKRRTISVETREKKAKLTLAEVEQIRSAYATGGVSQKSLAKQFSVDPSTVSHIVTGKRWTAVVQPRKEMK